MKNDVNATFFGDNKINSIKISDISANSSQPRTKFEQQALQRLAESIRINGLLQPLTVRKCGREYELISGERRLRALKMLDRKYAPCVIMEASERESAVLAIIENIQREDLNVFEQAAAIRSLISGWDVSQSEAAARLGMSQSAVANKLRLLRLTESERRTVNEYSLTERHARCVLKIDDEQKRKSALEHIARRGLNVEKAEKYVEKLLAAEKGGSTKLVFKDLRLFTNTINKAIETMRKSGVEAVAQKGESEKFIEYTIRIPKYCITQEKC